VRTLMLNNFSPQTPTFVQLSDPSGLFQVSLQSLMTRSLSYIYRWLYLVFNEAAILNVLVGACDSTSYLIQSDRCLGLGPTTACAPTRSSFPSSDCRPPIQVTITNTEAFDSEQAYHMLHSSPPRPLIR
jgi:hypothetical protein